MRIFYLIGLTAVFLVSCQMTKKNKSRSANLQNRNASAAFGEKVDAETLNVSLGAREFQKGNLSGISLVPKLDPRASYIAYSICSKGTANCIEGNIDGLLPDVLYNAPEGPEEISYQACVIPQRALKEKCGPKKILFYEHTGRNSPPTQLALTENTDWTHQLLHKGEDTQQALRMYLDAMPEVDDASSDFDVWAMNLASIDPKVLGRLYLSVALDDQFDRIRKEVNKQKRPGKNAGTGHSELGMGLLSLGHPVLAKAFFQDWKHEYQNEISETADYVHGVESMFTFGSQIQSNRDDADLTAVSIALQSLSVAGPRAALLEKLAGIETEIKQFKILIFESEIKAKTVGN